MTAIKVPYSQKEEAKKLGAKWDSLKSTWYVPDGLDLSLFSRWMESSASPPPAPATTPMADATLSVFDEMDPIESKSSATLEPGRQGTSSDKALSLSEFLAMVQRAVARAIPNSQWIRAEISEFSHRKNAIYMTVVEHNEEGREVAKVNAKMWGRDAEKIISKFSAATGSKLQANMKVLVAVTPEFHPQYGMSLQVVDIDPSFTLGDMAAKLNAIRQKLKQDGIFDLNRRLEAPWDFFRVAVIAPEVAAGLGDFRREADQIERFGLCQFHYFHAVFQGVNAPIEIRKQIQAIASLHAKNQFDVVVIIRGGGAVTDMAWLNDLDLAAALCQLNCPVFTGIGHERDNCILDEVAHRRFDTPSKVSAYIASVILTHGDEMHQMMEGIVKSAHNALLVGEKNAKLTMQSISAQALVLTERAEADAKKSFELVLQGAGKSLENAAKDVESVFREIMGLGPQATMNRGYTIAVCESGVLTSAEEAMKAKHIKLKFNDGDVPVKVIQ